MKASPNPLAVALIWTLQTSGLVHAEERLPQKLNLSNVVEMALKNHPEIESMRSKVAQAEARESAGPLLPAPMVSLGSMGDQGPLSGVMENSIEFSLGIPFPTKLVAESRQRGFEKEAAKQQLQAKLLELQAQTKIAYLELYRTRKQIGLLEDKKRAFESHSKRIGSLTLSDRIGQTHLIRIQTEIELAQNEIEKARRQEKVSQGELNLTMGHDPATAIPALEEPPVTELPRDDGQVEAQVTSHPQARALKASSDAMQASVDRANSSWFPDLSFKYRYNRRFDGVMSNNSEAMVGVELPFLLFWQPKGKAAEARAQLEEAQSKAKQTENELRLQTVKARAEAVSLRAQFESYTQRILPQALKRMKIAHSIAPGDMETLNEHRESMESYVELQMASLNLRVEYEKAVATLQSLTGSQEKRE